MVLSGPILLSLEVYNFGDWVQESNNNESLKAGMVPEEAKDATLRRENLAIEETPYSVEEIRVCRGQ